MTEDPLAKAERERLRLENDRDSLARELARVREVVDKFADLFSEPDERGMREARVTRATIDRYRREAGVIR